MCDHSFVMSFGKETKSITWYCVWCPETCEETVIIHDEFLEKRYKNFIDSRLKFSHLTKIEK